MGASNVAGVMRKPVSGWGRYPVQTCELVRPERYAELRPSGDGIIVRGQGRSYGDASLNAYGRVLLSERINRMLEFDSATGGVNREANLYPVVKLITRDGVRTVADTQLKPLFDTRVAKTRVTV